MHSSLFENTWKLISFLEVDVLIIVTRRPTDVGKFKQTSVVSLGMIVLFLVAKNMAILERERMLASCVWSKKFF